MGGLAFALLLRCARQGTQCGARRAPAAVAMHWQAAVAARLPRCQCATAAARAVPVSRPGTSSLHHHCMRNLKASLARWLSQGRTSGIKSPMAAISCQCRLPCAYCDGSTTSFPHTNSNRTPITLCPPGILVSYRVWRRALPVLPARDISYASSRPHSAARIAPPASTAAAATRPAEPAPLSPPPPLGAVPPPEDAGQVTIADCTPPTPAGQIQWHSGALRDDHQVCWQTLPRHVVHNTGIHNPGPTDLSGQNTGRCGRTGGRCRRRSWADYRTSRCKSREGHWHEVTRSAPRRL